ncbi:phage holin [Planococcus kocurii]|uniref:phage holin n=1 Tax=Planococcus kocurii TaxID=1374 RepID=UPI003D086772
MTTDKLKQYVAFAGGLLGALYAFLNSINVEYAFFNPESIDGALGVLTAAIPFVLIVYGIYKNTYLVTVEAKKQEALLKQRGLK